MNYYPIGDWRSETLRTETAEEATNRLAEDILRHIREREEQQQQNPPTNPGQPGIQDGLPSAAILSLRFLHLTPIQKLNYFIFVRPSSLEHLDAILRQARISREMHEASQSTSTAAAYEQWWMWGREAGMIDHYMHQANQAEREVEIEGKKIVLIQMMGQIIADRARHM